ncbi:MAG: LamG domain-containing protein, partial [Verrucomicrobia bacterium]|nr:LamG domain-containing protein [Verrucomicrobiota bacterium]
MTRGVARYQPTVPTANLAVTSGTVLLLPSGTGDHILRDASTNNFQITAVGDSRATNFTPYGTGWSVFFDGTGDYLNTPLNSITIGSGDFTIETWFYATTITGSERGIVGVGPYDAVGEPSKLSIRIIGSTAKLNAWVRGTGTWSNIQSTTTIALNTWYHVAFVRSGSSANNVRLYVNGILESSGSSTSSVTQDQLVIGRVYSASDIEYFAGSISNFRLVIGTAVYTANFVPPTAPLTAIANTSLLACHTNRFADGSANNLTITRNGDAAVRSFNPFNLTNIGTAGSMYFDGTGDYLNLPAGGMQASWTIELWWYPMSTGA